MKAIHGAIADGVLYQFNYAAPLDADFSGDPPAWLHAPQRAQPEGYATFIDTGGEASGHVLPVSLECSSSVAEATSLHGQCRAPRSAARQRPTTMRLRTARNRGEPVSTAADFRTKV